MRMLRNPRTEVPQTAILLSKQQSLADREFIDTAALVLLAGTQHGRGPFGLVRRVGVFLGLQADGRPESVNGALLPPDASVEEIAAVDLNAGLGS